MLPSRTVAQSPLLLLLRSCFFSPPAPGCGGWALFVICRPSVFSSPAWEEREKGRMGVGGGGREKDVSSERPLQTTAEPPPPYLVGPSACLVLTSFHLVTFSSRSRPAANIKTPSATVYNLAIHVPRGALSVNMSHRTDIYRSIGMVAKPTLPRRLHPQPTGGDPPQIPWCPGTNRLRRG